MTTTSQRDQSAPGVPRPEPKHSFMEVFSLFFWMGLTAFGGPAAHISFMQAEIVKRRKWITEQKFLDLLGITNMIPGPNSTEMAIHIGLLRAGWPGFLVGGLGFTLPAFCIVLALAWAYSQFGSTPQAGWLLYGIKPVVIAIILQALWNLSKKALKTPLLGMIGAGVVAGYFLGVNEILLLFLGGLLALLISQAGRLKAPVALLMGLAVPGFSGWVVSAFSYGTLFLSFFKIGSVLYGSGYVLLAFLRAEFVTHLGWLTETQLLDAIAVGQFTPGPFFTTATFIGYTLGGMEGAVLATLGIFLPSFIFVALSYRLLARFEKSPITRALLDGVNAASLGLMAGAAWQLGLASLVDPLTVFVAAAALFVLIRYKINASWLIAAGALIGLMRSILLPG